MDESLSLSRVGQQPRRLPCHANQQLVACTQSGLVKQSTLALERFVGLTGNPLGR